MIAVDTNVVLRYLLQDDDRQSAKANRIFGAYRRVLLTDAVLIETMWTLKGKRYRIDKARQVMVLTRLFSETGIYFECKKTVWYAINLYRLARPIKLGGKTRKADFADILIAEKARTIARKRNAPYEGIYTFDVAAQ